MMRHLIASLVGVVLLLVGCAHDQVVRDAGVYQAELDQYDRWAVHQAEMLRDFVASDCPCDGDQFAEARCRDAADWLLTVEARHAWHRDMAWFNAGVSELRPATVPPPIPPSTCPLTAPPAPEVR